MKKKTNQKTTMHLETAKDNKPSGDSPPDSKGNSWIKRAAKPAPVQKWNTIPSVCWPVRLSNGLTRCILTFPWSKKRLHNSECLIMIQDCFSQLYLRSLNPLSLNSHIQITSKTSNLPRLKLPLRSVRTSFTRGWIIGDTGIIGKCPSPTPPLLASKLLGNITWEIRNVS